MFFGDDDSDTEYPPWELCFDIDPVLAYSVAHRVLPQLLRPLAASVLPPEDVDLSRPSDAARFVTSLKLIDAEVPEFLQFAATLPLLTGLDFGTARMSRRKDVNTDIIARLPTEFPHLRELDVGRCRRVGAECLAHISKLTELRVLHIGSCLVDAAGASHLPALTKLHTLTIADTDVNYDELRFITELSGLRWLCVNCCLRMDSAGFGYIERLQRLEHLIMMGCNVDERCLRHISGIPTLRRLRMTGCDGIDATGLAHLSKLPGLEELYLSDVDAQGLRHLSKLRTLKVLRCEGDGLDESALDPVRFVPTLKY